MLSCTERLSQDDEGLMPLYDAAMCLMKEVTASQLVHHIYLIL